TNYCGSNFAANNAYCQQNWGRTATGTGSGGRGICPENWHVPTYYEWVVILDGMESGGGTMHQNALGIGWKGTNAGSRARSKCMCGLGVPTPSCVDDVQINWMHQRWDYGVDALHLGILPTGLRDVGYWLDPNHTNPYIPDREPAVLWLRGEVANLWTSSVRDEKYVVILHFAAWTAQVQHSVEVRVNGLPVRCTRD
ncbi:MAG: hypothetical protein LBD87_05080, partial [Prevotellaceae bacterium]|nr:hypothetical protein [Prevotellaceae bacterium]